MPMVDQTCSSKLAAYINKLSLVKVEHAQRLIKTMHAETVEHVGILLLKNVAYGKH